MCKFYQGSEDKQLENKLRKMFERVYREKPDSSRSVSNMPSFLNPQPLLFSFSFLPAREREPSPRMSLLRRVLVGKITKSEAHTTNDYHAFYSRGSRNQENHSSWPCGAMAM